MLSIHAPTIEEFGIRQAWLADPVMMSYNADWDITYPGYDRTTGCIDWPESDWPTFQTRLALPPARQGYYYVLDTDMDQFIGHIHYLVGPDGVAEIGFNVIPERRGQGLGAQFLRLLLDRVWEDTPAQVIVQEFEDQRIAAVKVHQQCGFTPERETATRHGRPTRTWRLARP
ncbi:GNAT family N-acetyltransferase [Actinotalea sp. M2MS4P-6]|uniref:GNAT family N-acetyltransferase n=1 Tax=Actinotalea sp. M2MS4P-6 TaxID=2983762 RepID=UPI0021E48301|nr:GNAT family N-acetyltransferase [Actinotalea sp. M2MS4P-6]MCV2395350.1 GNAT family N-acetyltransferase [Actinotalea sp. M2MS4P-6]